MKVLCIDDNKTDQELCTALIRRTKNWTIICADSVGEGLLLCETEKPQVVLIDIAFPNRPDEEAFYAMTSMAKESTVIALSGREDQESVDRAHQAGAAAFINKTAFGSPQKFHDKILAALKRGLTGAVLEDHRWSIVEQLAEAVLWGNGRPGLLARVEAIDAKLDAGDGRFDTIEKKLDSSRVETRIRAVIMIVLMLITVFKLITNQSPSAALDAFQKVEEAEGK